MSDKPIAVVTGGAGFIGSHMVDLLLERGMAVRVIDNLVGGREQNLAAPQANRDLAFEKRDIRTLSPGEALFAGAAYVFHFAGIGDIVPSIERPTEYMSINVQGTVHVLEAARACRQLKKFVYAASSSCYGLADDAHARGPPDRPQYPYALSKYQGEQAAFHWHQVYRLPVNSIRIFNAYGIALAHHGRLWRRVRRVPEPEARGQAVHGGRRRHADAAISSTPPTWHGVPRRRRKTDRGTSLELGAGNPQSVNRLVELIGGSTVAIPKRPGEPDCTWADISRISGPRLEPEDFLRGRRGADDGRDRILARRAAVGPRFDRQGDQDLVRLLSPDAEGRVP